MNGPNLSYTCPMENCEASIEVGSDVEPADHNYGADADGHRGIYVPAQIIPDEPPEVCPECGHEYTKDELEGIALRLGKAADEWEAPEYDEPEYDPCD